MEEGQYQTALDSFEKLKGYKDSDSMAEECRKNLLYNDAKDDMEKQDYTAAIEKLQGLGDFLDSPELLEQCRSLLYSQAVDKIKEQDYEAAKERFVLLGDYEDSEQWLNMVKGIIEYNKQNYRGAWTFFEQVDSSFSGNNKEFYEGWLSASLTMDIFNRQKIDINNVLELYKKVPESHKDDNKQFFDALARLKKCDGTYIYKPGDAGPYQLTLKYWLKKGSVKADLTYENFTGSIDNPGDVSMLEGDKEYEFLIQVTGNQTYRSRTITIKINPEHAEVKSSGAYGNSEDCYRESH